MAEPIEPISDERITYIASLQLYPTPDEIAGMIVRIARDRDHIAALEAALAAAHAAVRAGDAVEASELGAATYTDGSLFFYCINCRAEWRKGTPAKHAMACPVGAYHTARAGVKLPEDGA